MRILVTGGAGYIGSTTVRRLTAAGHMPVVLDTLERGHREALDGACLIVGSVQDGDLVRTVLRDEAIEAVIHFAALKSVEESVADPGRYFSVNVAGSIQLVEAMTAAGVERLVYSSSAAVYGAPAEVPVRETTSTRPENPYGETKLVVEQMLRWWSASGRVSTAILRYFNAAGASPDGRHGEVSERATNLLPIALRAARGGIPALDVYGTDYPTPDGTAIRDYIHVDDLADAHIRALDHLAAGGPSVTLNLGTGRGTSVREIVRAVERVTGRSLPTIDRPRRAGDPPAVWADVGEARRVLGWSAQRTIDEIVAHAWAWESNHPAGYASPATARP